MDKKVLCRLIIDSFNDENLIKKPLPFIIVLVSSGIHIKSQRPGDLSNRNYFSRFWRLEVSDQSHSDGSSLLDLQMATLSSHGFSSEQPQNEKERYLYSLSYGVTNPIELSPYPSDLT